MTPAPVPRSLLNLGSEIRTFSGGFRQFRAPCASRLSFRLSCARSPALAAPAQSGSTRLRSTLSLERRFGFGLQTHKASGFPSSGILLQRAASGTLSALDARLAVQPVQTLRQVLPFPAAAAGLALATPAPCRRRAPSYRARKNAEHGAAANGCGLSRRLLFLLHPLSARGASLPFHLFLPSHPAAGAPALRRR